MGSKYLGLDRGIVEGLGLRNVVLPGDEDVFDHALKKYGRVSFDGVSEELRAVVFAVVTYNGSVLVVEKEGEVVLGFGGGCRAVSVYSLCRACLAEQLHEELELYIPGKRYGIRPVGLVYCDQREYDAGSVGFLFRVALGDAVESRLVDGKGSRVCLRELGDVDRGALRGWSRIIYDLLDFQWRIGVGRGGI